MVYDLFNPVEPSMRVPVQRWKWNTDWTDRADQTRWQGGSDRSRATSSHSGTTTGKYYSRKVFSGVGRMLK